MKRAALLIALALVVTVAKADTVHLRRLIGVGDTVAGLVVTDLRLVSQNESGEIVVAGNSSAHDHTIWAGHPGFLEVVVRNGLTGPGGGAFGSVSASALVPPVINDEGAVAFLASEGDTGMYTFVNGVFGKVARHGDPVPGIAGATFAMNFGNVTRPAFSRTHALRFLARLDGSTTSADNMALWGGPAGAGQLIAREGGAIPGQAGLSFPSLNGIFEIAETSTAGATALATALAGDGVVEDVNDTAVLAGDGTGFGIVARGGDAATADGLPPDATFAGFGDHAPVRINERGELLFFAGLSGTGISGTLLTGNHVSLWKGTSGSLEMIARRGDSAPGLPEGVTLLLYTSLLPDPDHLAIAGTGDAAFITTLGGAVTSSDDTALYASLAGMNRLVLREGMAAPGMPPGVVFNQVSAFQGWRFAINGAGQLAILADLAGTGVTNANDAALYFWSESDGLQLVAREGDSAEVAPGEFRLVSGIALHPTHGDDSGGPRNFNSRGQLTFSANLDGAAAILRATLVSPATHTLGPSTSHSAGGGRIASADYRIDADQTAGAGVGESAAYLAKVGFVGQLYDVVGLTATAAPGSVPENSSTQLTAVGLMDDETLVALPSGTARWSIVSGPLSSIVQETGIASTGVVYEDTEAVVLARLDSYQGPASLVVIDSDPDNFAEYAGDELDDGWQVLNFGLPPNADALPGANPDFDEQDNRFEFLAGTDPGDPASFFSIRLEMVAPDAAEITLSKVIPGTRYRLLRTTNLDAPQPWPELRNFTVDAEAGPYVVEDLAPLPPRAFYRVALDRP